MFRAEARDFAEVAHVTNFLRAHQPVNDSATTRARRLIDTKAHLDWFTKFFSEASGDLLIVSPLPATVFTIGMRLEPGHAYAISFGPAFTSDDGYPNQRLDLTFHTRSTGVR